MHKRPDRATERVALVMNKQPLVGGFEGKGRETSVLFCHSTTIRKPRRKQNPKQGRPWPKVDGKKLWWKRWMDRYHLFIGKATNAGGIAVTRQF